MKLYIANCTHQTQQLNYRVVEAPGRGYSTQNIAMGRQEQIASDMNMEQVNYVVKQLEHYGLRSVAQTDGSREYVPLIFSIDRPVPAKLMQEMLAFNSTVLKERGNKLRRDAAIATSHGMREFSPAAAETVSMSVEEEKQGTMDHGGEQPLAEGFRMSREINA